MWQNSSLFHMLSQFVEFMTNFKLHLSKVTPWHTELNMISIFPFVSSIVLSEQKLYA